MIDRGIQSYEQKRNIYMQLPKEIKDAMKKEAKEKGIDEEVLLIEYLILIFLLSRHYIIL